MKDVQDFQIEWRVLLAVTISGLIYNLGLLVGPWFEGQDGDIYFTQNDCFDGTYDFYIIVCNRTDKPDVHSRSTLQSLLCTQMCIFRILRQSPTRTLL